jgi:hypothetical protein
VKVKLFVAELCSTYEDDLTGEAGRKDAIQELENSINKEIESRNPETCGVQIFQSSAQIGGGDIEDNVVTHVTVMVTLT